MSAGQVYDDPCQGSTTGDSGFGAYGLQVNFGSLTQPPVTPPDTTMAEAADQGGGTMGDARRITVGDSVGTSAMPIDGRRRGRTARPRTCTRRRGGIGATWAPSLAAHRGPITVFGPASEPTRRTRMCLTTLDFSPQDDHGNVDLPTLLQSKNRRPASMHHETVDRAIDGTRPDPPG